MVAKVYLLVVRRPHQKGEAMFNIGLIGCYLSLLWGIVVLDSILAGFGQTDEQAFQTKDCDYR